MDPVSIAPVLAQVKRHKSPPKLRQALLKQVLAVIACHHHHRAPFCKFSSLLQAAGRLTYLQTAALTSSCLTGCITGIMGLQPWLELDAFSFLNLKV